MATTVEMIVGFVLTSIVGNHIVQTWQQRNWLLQQRFLGQEKEYIALKELADGISNKLGVRIYYMQRLSKLLAAGTKEQILEAYSEHNTTVKTWNESLPTFYIRIPILAKDQQLIYFLEKIIQTRLVSASSRLDSAVRRMKENEKISRSHIVEIENKINEIQGTAINFNKKLLSIVETRRGEVYFGRRIYFTPYTLNKFSTWQLVKALFIRDINTYSIISPAININSPSRRWS